MANLLKQLELSELSLVDRPANAQAKVSLFKRDNSDGENMTNEELTKKLEELEASVDTLTKSEDTLKAENEFLRKSLIDNGFIIKSDIVEKKAEPEFIDVDGEQVNKADIPAPILKALEKAEADKKALEIEKADVELTKRAGETLPNFKVEVAKSLLNLVEKSDDFDAIMEALKAADAIFAQKMDEIGNQGQSDDLKSATEKLDDMVKAHMTENNMTVKEYAKAYAAVAKTDAGKALINKSYKEKE